MALIVSSRAERHVLAAKNWYDEHRLGLGSDFLDSVERQFEVIEAFPTRFAVQFGNVRIAMVDGFPYLILFRANQKNVRVIAVFHNRRNPQLWKR